MINVMGGGGESDSVFVPILNDTDKSNPLMSTSCYDNFDVIFIENVGNLICPSDFILGTHKRIVVVSITEGPWVIRKHPMLFKFSDIAVINKIDLIDVIDVDIEEMIRDALEINPNIKVITTSANTEENIPELVKEIFSN